jgi:tyrosine-protein kinase Etk/Wzc
MDNSLAPSGRDGLPASEGAAPGRVPVEDPRHGIDLRDLGRSLFRAWPLVLTITVLSASAAIVLTALQAREYEAEATLFVAMPRASALNRELGGLAGLVSIADLGQNNIATEAAILRSRRIAETVVDSLSLHVRLIHPRTARGNVLEVLESPRDALTGTYEFRLQGDGTYSVHPQATPVPEDHPSRVEVGSPFSLGNVRLVLRPFPGAEPPKKLVIAVGDFQRAANSLQRDLEVSIAGRGTQILSVRARTADSVFAAAIPNAVAQSFVLYRSNVSNEEARTSVRFLELQVAHYAARLEEAEARLQAYQEQDRIVNPSDQASLQIRQVSDMRARRDLLVTEREAIGRLLRQAESSSQNAGGSSPYRELASFPVFISNSAVQNVLRVLTDLENQRTELLVRRTPENIDIQRIDRRIGELEVQLYAMARSYREGLDSQIASLDDALSEFGIQLEAVPAQQLTFARLTREKRLLEEIYTLLQSRLKEAEIRKAGEPTDVRVLDAALVPEKPVSPRPMLNLVLGLMLGLMLGTGAALARVIVDPKVRSRTDAIAATSGLPVIGMIPSLPGSHGNGIAARSRYKLDRLFMSRAPASEPAPPLVVKADPNGWAAEAYRSLRANLTLHVQSRTPRVLVVCSASEGDGKTTCAANLAVATAQQGLRTLLLDCDLRKPGLHRIFGIDSTPGLSDVLLGRATHTAAVRHVDLASGDGSLDVLPSGDAAPQLAELVGSKSMRALLDQLRAEYDVLIVDAPPLAISMDAAVLGAMADSTVLVARATFSQKRAVAEAVAQLRQLRIPLGGVIVNDVDPSDLSYSYQYGRYSGAPGA